MFESYDFNYKSIANNLNTPTELKIKSFLSKTYKYQENEYMNILFYIFIFLLIVFIFFYISLLIIDPGVRRRRSLEELKSLLKNKVDLTKYCYKCFVLKTKTSKHCIICDCCYNNFDHHFTSSSILIGINLID